MLNKVYTLQFINSAKTFLPEGQIKYHIKNYKKYFRLNKREISKKKDIRNWCWTWCTCSDSIFYLCKCLCS